MCGIVGYAGSKDAKGLEKLEYRGYDSAGIALMCGDGVLVFKEKGRIDAEILDAVKDADRIYMIACGTSYHAGLVGKHLFEKLASIPVESHVASEFLYNRVASAKAYTAQIAVLTLFVSACARAIGKTLPFNPVLELGSAAMAYYAALFRGCDIDKPRNLAKSVTVE